MTWSHLPLDCNFILYRWREQKNRNLTEQQKPSSKVKKDRICEECENIQRADRLASSQEDLYAVCIMSSTVTAKSSTHSNGNYNPQEGSRK